MAKASVIAQLGISGAIQVLEPAEAAITGFEKQIMYKKNIEKYIEKYLGKFCPRTNIGSCDLEHFNYFT